MKKLFGFCSILILAVIVALSGEGHVRAQNVGLTMSPVNFEFAANPGETVSNKLKISNPSRSAIAVQMTVEDFAVSGESGQVVIEPAQTETYSLARWVTVTPLSFTLEANATQVVDFIVSVPLNAEPGGHYGSVLASMTGIAGGEGFAGVGVSQKVGSLILLSVAGDVVEDLEVIEFTAPEFLEYGPVPFVLRLENKGSVHVRPRGLLSITNWRDKKVVDIEFPQNNVLPDSTRKIEASWDTKWLFGKYTATLVGSYGSANAPLSPWIVTFWVFPWKIGSVVGGGAFFILLFFFLSRRRWVTAIRILLRGERKRL